MAEEGSVASALSEDVQLSQCLTNAVTGQATLTGFRGP